MFIIKSIRCKKKTKISIRTTLVHFKNKFTQYHTLFEIQMKFNKKNLKKYV